MTKSTVNQERAEFLTSLVSPGQALHFRFNFGGWTLQLKDNQTLPVTCHEMLFLMDYIQDHGSKQARCLSELYNPSDSDSKSIAARETLDDSGIKETCTGAGSVVSSRERRD
ncbi:hypothetical protein TREMEDRAFT_62851 [Tremella mesenterica DSM 1558]|uniref:uncharacterized protein n=1 Tax=Tremella mesenterica (strain ATCC 24925 / CBS 8224 / DSM 1558 / NBRC 9311 / NRRL Y-6157 / RJB 2259-6 / UBC 559-6) TaxID=578456 RepID=UPI0003F49EA2|nr:uncharacterized protein TREMEDRAFT_62851 [Tremella mesenterica DSM 1558]EIW69125.1 hypothetical protein TREMEDRAFT_62851 [Tremella mesenterica DSM 1558]